MAVLVIDLGLKCLVPDFSLIFEERWYIGLSKDVITHFKQRLNANVRLTPSFVLLRLWNHV